jgi:hypothetical protein
VVRDGELVKQTADISIWIYKLHRTISSDMVLAVVLCYTW